MTATTNAPILNNKLQGSRAKTLLTMFATKEEMTPPSRPPANGAPTPRA